MVSIFLLAFSTILICSYLIINLIFIDKIKVLDKQITVLNDFQKALYLPFFILLNQYIKNSSLLLSNNAKKSIKYFHGENFYKFYELIFLSKKLTILISYLYFSLISTAFCKIYILLIFHAFIIIFFNWYLDKSEEMKYTLVNDSIKLELPNFLTRLSLLVDSGIPYRKSLDEILKKRKTNLAGEFIKVKDRMENGEDEKSAYSKLAQMSDDILLKKFISLIIQNIYKGTDDFSHSLKYLKIESTNYRKKILQDKSKKAVQKLLLPNLLIFTSIMLMIMLPVIIKAF